MDSLDLERAKRLLKSAEYLVKLGDVAGAGGLAYQAFESAIIAVTKMEGKKDSPDHVKRQNMAKDLLQMPPEAAIKLWAVRNVDFYGNEKRGEEPRQISLNEIKQSLEEVRKVIQRVEQKGKKEQSTKEESGDDP